MRSEYEDRLTSTDTDAQPATTAAETTAPAEIRAAATSTPDIVEDVLIEEVSIDGMCGVY